MIPSERYFMYPTRENPEHDIKEEPATKDIKLEPDWEERLLQEFPDLDVKPKPSILWEGDVVKTPQIKFQEPPTLHTIQASIPLEPLVQLPPESPPIPNDNITEQTIDEMFADTFEQFRKNLKHKERGVSSLKHFLDFLPRNIQNMNNALNNKCVEYERVNKEVNMLRNAKAVHDTAYNNFKTFVQRGPRAMSGFVLEETTAILVQFESVNRQLDIKLTKLAAIDKKIRDLQNQVFAAMNDYRKSEIICENYHRRHRTFQTNIHSFLDSFKTT